MEKIATVLNQIELEEKIRILYACETGSRAWGFPSPDSDYDVRFIYRHERDWYLSLGQRKDSVECMLENDLDISGWDLKKSLVLLKKSNAALIERFQSPVVYFSNPGFTEEFKSLIEAYYSPVAVFYHHYSLAARFREEIGDKRQVKLKSYFYLLRSLLSCNWIGKMKEVLPMHIEGLMTIIEEEKRQEINKLIGLKATVTEAYIYEKDKEMDAWMDELLGSIEDYKINLAVSAASSYALLDSFFLKTLNNDVDNRMDKE